MSQRGGSVTSHVRWGRQVYSPLIGAGEVDVMMAFEEAEALRSINLLRRDALVLVNEEAIAAYCHLWRTALSRGRACGRCLQAGDDNAYFIPASQIALDAGSGKAANVVLLGALSKLLEDKVNLSTEQWLEVIMERVPKKFAELNKQAFMMAATRSAKIFV